MATDNAQLEWNNVKACEDEDHKLIYRIFMDTFHVFMKFIISEFTLGNGVQEWITRCVSINLYFCWIRDIYLSIWREQVLSKTSCLYFIKYKPYI